MFSYRRFAILFIDKGKSFKEENRLELLYVYEVSIKESKKLKLNEWTHLINLYLINFLKTLPLLQFLRRFYCLFK
jgi:hypothetical protein